MLSRFYDDEDGALAVDYGVFMAVLVLTIIVAVSAFSRVVATRNLSTFTSISSAMN